MVGSPQRGSERVGPEGSSGCDMQGFASWDIQSSRMERISCLCSGGHRRAVTGVELDLLVGFDPIFNADPVLGEDVQGTVVQQRERGRVVVGMAKLPSVLELVCEFGPEDLALGPDLVSFAEFIYVQVDLRRVWFRCEAGGARTSSEGARARCQVGCICSPVPQCVGQQEQAWMLFPRQPDARAERRKGSGGRDGSRKIRQ